VLSSCPNIRFLPSSKDKQDARLQAGQVVGLYSIGFDSNKIGHHQTDRSREWRMSKATDYIVEFLLLADHSFAANGCLINSN